MSQEIVDQLKHIIAEKLDMNIKLEDIEDNAPLFEDGLGFDSIAIMEFITVLEAHYGFKFSEEELDMELFQDLPSIAGLIANKLAA